MVMEHYYINFSGNFLKFYILYLLWSYSERFNMFSFIFLTRCFWINKTKTGGMDIFFIWIICFILVLIYFCNFCFLYNFLIFNLIIITFKVLASNFKNQTTSKVTKQLPKCFLKPSY